MNIQQFYRSGEKLSKEPFHYTACGLGNIYLSNGFEHDTIDGEDVLTIHDMDGLHRAIGLHIVLEKKAPSGAELKFLRGELDMSQAELARVMGVTDQSVARWEKGQCEANGPAIFSLRVVYLLSLLPPEEREKVMGGLLARLKKLAEQDEEDDNIVLSYSGHHWREPALAA